ncbi:TlpA disulfide reductase family protein [Taibaiella sp. KBW10]|uniref:TlpA family protein disulfide reductase n=1 Tax=Taibaiella sp. KBW10 TaxID=2153357 RepID=UPI001315AC84|nr:TlpA disulfide reductase family protein [Taibaiella sp. KBW10]
MITGIILGTILAVSALGYLYYVSKRNMAQSDAIGKSKHFKELNLPLKDLEGKPVDMMQFSDKYVLVNFWGTWCLPCVQEMPMLQNEYKALKEKYVFVMISDEDPQTIKAFKEKKGYDFVFVRSEEILQSMIGVFPTTFILDKSQRIIFTKTGSFENMDPNGFKQLLLKQIK